MWEYIKSVDILNCHYFQQNAMYNTIILIKWKHVLLGFLNDQKRKSYNWIPSSFLAHRIYKFKMHCRVHSIEETNNNILSHVKASTVFYASIWKSLNSYADYRIFENCKINLKNLLPYMYILYLIDVISFCFIWYTTDIINKSNFFLNCII